MSANKYLSFESWVDLWNTVRLDPEEYPPVSVQRCYHFAMMTVSDEMETDRHEQMSRVEFYEALARVAALYTPNLEDGGEALLCMKLTRLIDFMLAGLHDAARGDRGSSDWEDSDSSSSDDDDTGAFGGISALEPDADRSVGDASDADGYSTP